MTILRHQVHNHLSSEFRTFHSCVPLMAKKKKERNDEDYTLDVDDVLKRSKHPKRRTESKCVFLLFQRMIIIL